MKLFFILIYDRSVERLWTAKKQFMYFEVRETQSGRLPSRTGYQSDWVTGPTGIQSPSWGLELVHPYYGPCTL